MYRPFLESLYVVHEKKVIFCFKKQFRSKFEIQIQGSRQFSGYVLMECSLKIQFALYIYEIRVYSIHPNLTFFDCLFVGWSLVGWSLVGLFADAIYILRKAGFKNTFKRNFRIIRYFETLSHFSWENFYQSSPTSIFVPVSKPICLAIPIVTAGRICCCYFFMNF